MASDGSSNDARVKTAVSGPGWIVTDDVSTWPSPCPNPVDSVAPSNAAAPTNARIRCRIVIVGPFAAGGQVTDSEVGRPMDAPRKWVESYGPVTTFTVPVEV